MNLENKVVLIVGGASGIGRASAELCVKRGAKVVIADFQEETGQTVAREIGASFVRVNVADEASVAAMCTHVKSTHGALHALVQTAGVLKGPFVDIADFSAETFREVFDINVLGSFLCAKHASPMLKASHGVIVLFSSQAATNASSSYAYGSSKGAVTSLAITMAAKLAPDNIRVNVVAPGNIDTAMKRGVIDAEVALKGARSEQAQLTLGSSEGMAKIVAWLVSDDAEYVRGVVTTR
jgi:NAD(P)-dependent dehydrogenase (short-subunit alcohol dehydrogenase family)